MDEEKELAELQHHFLLKKNMGPVIEALNKS
jgi:hypothetical protein